jgi:hypothetical protein
MRRASLVAIIGDLALVLVLILVDAPSILIAACALGALLAAGAYVSFRRQ